ncbi:hypothetical protein FRX31_014203, partial [Thalictrum thalictroides]
LNKLPRLRQDHSPLLALLPNLVNTERAIRLAIQERLPIVLVINKVCFLS